MPKRKQHAPEFEAKVALKGGAIVSELASWFGVLSDDDQSIEARAA